MQYATRLANPDVAQCYPLHVSGPVNWAADGAADSTSTWVYELVLPDLPAGHIIVPSFASYDNDANYRYQFALSTADQEYSLNPVPGQVPVQAPAKETKAESKGKVSDKAEVSCHIDCWHSEQPIRAAKVRLTVTTPSQPMRYLLTVTIRELTHSATIETSQHNICISVPASISQMQATPDLKQRICSPTALAMALSVFEPAPTWHDTVQACYDPQTRAYGAWPLAIRWASRHGIVGAVEALNGWHDAIEILHTGTPLVCSIHFAKGKLKGAPLSHTGGHLVLLYGLAGDKVLVRDPAAETDETVDRSYSMQEFTEAWLRRRGAAYIFCKHVLDR